MCHGKRNGQKERGKEAEEGSGKKEIRFLKNRPDPLGPAGFYHATPLRRP
jgi:hypothetical protein